MTITANRSSTTYPCPRHPDGVVRYRAVYDTWECTYYRDRIAFGHVVPTPVPETPGHWEVEPVFLLDGEKQVEHVEPEQANAWGLYFYSPACMDIEHDGEPRRGSCHRWHADFSDRETAEHVAQVLNAEGYHPEHA
jgi:hypothetical protein